MEFQYQHQLLQIDSFPILWLPSFQLTHLHAKFIWGNMKIYLLLDTILTFIFIISCAEYICETIKIYLHFIYDFLILVDIHKYLTNVFRLSYVHLSNSFFIVLTYHAYDTQGSCCVCTCPANERRRYIVTSSLIDWAHIQNDPWILRQYR